MVCSVRTPLVVHAFWDDATCLRVRRAIDKGHHSEAEVESGGFGVNARARRATDIEVDDATVIFADAELARARRLASRHFGIPLTSAEGSGFLRYGPGDFYGPHQDCLVDLADVFQRRITVVVFLVSSLESGGGDCEGGALRLSPETEPGGRPLDVVPRRGTLVAFPADMLHEVLPVSAGTRDVVIDRFY
jgi:predicted 2-oxoglutarate/Fe(II)-dependent dioxygenase YbiX